MARLNTTAAPRTPDPRLRRKASFQSSPASSRPGLRVSTSTSTKEAKQWTMGSETSSDSKSGGSGSGNIPLRKSQSQRNRKRKGSGACFDIFPDAGGTGETEEDGDGPSSQDPAIGDSEGKTKSTSKSPLRSAKVNSLLLPVPAQARSRPVRKSEVDYDKENDLVEGDVDGLSTGNTREERQSPTRRDRGPGEARNGRQSHGFRESVSQDEAASDSDSEDNGFDSMDDFVVSDNEELSFYETSEDETETTPPPPSRRKLFRGRRPDSKADVKSELESPSQKTALRLEPSLLSTLATPSSMSDSRPRKMSQDEHLDIDEKIGRLSLENNDVSSQLEKGLHQVVAELDSPSQQSDSGQEILQTPPSSPSKNRVLSPTKLSPTKRKVDIPASPHREGADAFWSQELTNDWVDQHSPRKLEQLLRDFRNSDNEESDTMPRSRRTHEPKTPSKTALKRAETKKRAAHLARKKSFNNKKTAVAEDFLSVLDDSVTGGQIQRLTEETGGVRIVWSKTLQKTAGRANWKRKQTAYPAPTGQLSPFPSQAYPCTYPGKVKHQAFIELAERIVDDEYRLINTLSHEYCHLANFMISGVRDNPHGASFKQWGRRTEEALKDHPIYGGRITVTTKHDYEIDYKYVWSCVDCARKYGRHSKSIDTTRSHCSICKGSLQQIKPKPRNVSPRKQGVGGTSAVDDMAAVLGEVSLHN